MHATLERQAAQSREAGLSADSSVQVRRYKPEDRTAVRWLCCETGFLGEPIDPIFHDRELFADLLTNAYLNYEPQWAFVAEKNGRIVGYLLGSVSPQFQRVLLRTGAQTASRMLWRCVRGNYADKPRSKRFVRWLFSTAFWQQPKHPRGAAHLHLNLAREYRGNGVGRDMWEVYSALLQKAEVPSCYGEFFSYGRRRPEHAYARFGFKVFDRKKTTFFYPEVPEAELVCVHKTFEY